MESFATLDSCRNVADDRTQCALPFGISLFVEGGQSLHQRNTGFDHGRELASEKNEVGLFYGSRLPTRGAGGRFSLQRKHHQTATHQTGHGIVFIESVLDTRDDAPRGVARLVGERDHKIGIIEIVAARVPVSPRRPAYMLLDLKFKKLNNRYLRYG